MHEAVAKELLKWAASLPNGLKGLKIADLGSYYINGSVKELLGREVVGFDITEGPNVDVNLKSVGVEHLHAYDVHLHAYDVVISISTLQCAVDPEEFKREALYLLKPGGALFLTACGPTCPMRHSSSPGNMDSMRRWDVPKTRSFFCPEFSPWRFYIVGSSSHHEDVVYIGIKEG